MLEEIIEPDYLSNYNPILLVAYGNKGDFTDLIRDREL
jgi:hypothetical protein